MKENQLKITIVNPSRTQSDTQTYTYQRCIFLLDILWGWAFLGTGGMLQFCVEIQQDLKEKLWCLCACMFYSNCTCGACFLTIKFEFCTWCSFLKVSSSLCLTNRLLGDFWMWLLALAFYPNLVIFREVSFPQVPNFLSFLGVCKYLFLPKNPVHLNPPQVALQPLWHCYVSWVLLEAHPWKMLGKR